MNTKHKVWAWLGKRIIHITVSIVLGIIIAALVHMILENNRVRSRAESLCTLFSKTDQSVCKYSINSILDMADEDFQNYVQSKGIE